MYRFQPAVYLGLSQDPEASGFKAENNQYSRRKSNRGHDNIFSKNLTL